MIVGGETARSQGCRATLRSGQDFCLFGGAPAGSHAPGTAATANPQLRADVVPRTVRTNLDRIKAGFPELHKRSQVTVLPNPAVLLLGQLVGEQVRNQDYRSVIAYRARRSRPLAAESRRAEKVGVGVADLKSRDPSGVICAKDGFARQGVVDVRARAFLDGQLRLLHKSGYCPQPLSHGQERRAGASRARRP